MVKRIDVRRAWRRVWAAAALSALALVSPGVMANFAYTANPATGGTASPSVAGSIYWMDWSGISLPTSGSSQNASFTLADGSILSLTITRGGTTTAAFAATQPPSYSGSAVGNAGYCFPTCGSQTGAPYVVLYTTSGMGTTGGNPNTLSFTLSGITLTNPAGNPVANYQVVMADGESTDSGDGTGANWTYTTTGGNWAQVDYLASTSGGSNGAALTLSGQTAVQSATTSGNGPSWVVATASPGTVSGNSNFQITAATTSSQKQGVMLGIRLGQISLTKNITARANASDQFSYNIINAAGTSVGQGASPCATMGPCTTTGATTGNQTTISSSIAPGNTIQLSETMASGSASSLGAYTSTIACTNSNSGSTTVLPSGTYNPSSPPTITLQSQSDNVNCTITNNAAVLTVTKGTPTITNTSGNTYTAAYTVTVANTGTATGKYTLTDTPGFPSGVTLNSWTVTTTGGTVNSPLPAVANNTAAQISASNVTIARNTTHTYTVTINFTTSSSVPALSLTCSSTGIAGSGAFNVATLTNTTSTPNTNTTAYGCSTLPGTTAIVVSKSAPAITSTGTNTYSAVYTVTVVNTGTAAGQYTLTDTPGFPSGVTFNSWTVATSGGTVNNGLASVPTNNTANRISGNNVSIAAGTTDTYTVTINYTMSSSVPASSLACSGSAGSGAYNAVTATPRTGTAATANGCGALTGVPSLTVAKGVPTIANTGGNTYSATYTLTVSNTGGGTGTYTLTDTPGFPATGVTLTNWTAATTSGTLNSPFPAVANNTAAQISASNVSIAAGTTSTPTTHTYTVTINYTLTSAASALTCNGSAGNGAYNATTITGSSSATANNCGPLNAIVAVTINKTVTGAPAAGAPGAYAFSLVCSNGTYTGTVTLTGTATSGSTTVDVPQGATCSTLTETSKAPAPTNYTWGTATTVAPGTIAAASSGTITNPLSAIPGTLTVTKTITGGPATTSAMAFPFSVACSTPTATYTGTVNVAANATTGSTTVSIPAGSTSCAITEATRPTAPTNYTWGTATYTQPAATAMAAGGTASGAITNPLSANAGTLTVTKTITGGPATTSAMAFPFSVACSTPTATYTGTVNVAANATTGSTTVSIPAGSTSCTIAEGTLPTAPTNYTWGTPTYTQPAATAMTAGGTASGAITNPLSANPGTLTVTKTITGGPATTSAMAFPFTVGCSTPTATYSGTVNVAANATTGSTTVSIPAGSTSCTITEGTRPTAPTNYTWGTVTYTQPSATAMAAGGTASGSITNPLTRNQIAVTISKAVTGAPAAGAPGAYAFSLVCDTGTYSGSVTLTGTATSGSTTVTVPQGATCSTLNETSKASAPTNYTWGTETTVPPTGTIATGSSGSITNPLSANAGTLTVTKNVTGGPATTNAMAFLFSVACQSPSATYSGTVNVAANATTGSTTVSIPAGSTNCTITEGTPPTAPTNYTWGTTTYTQPAATAMAAGGTASGSITNPLTRNQITVTVTKTVTGAPASGAPGAYNYSIACGNPTATYTGAVTLTGTATSGTSTVSIPAGSTGCTISETSTPTAPTNYTWGTPTYTQPPATLPASGTSTAAIGNPLSANPGSLTVNKTVSGGPATTSAMSFPVSVACQTPTATYTGTISVAANATTGSVTISNIPSGTTNCQITEGTQPTAPTNYSWSAPVYTQPAQTALAAGGSLTGAITNPLARNQIAVTINKTVTGAPAAGAPGAYAFSLVCDSGTYTGTVTLAGTATTGSTTVNVPQGATCSTLNETSKATAPASYSWGTETTVPPTGTIATGSNGSITNPLNANPGTLTVTKTIDGPAFASATSYGFSVSCSTPTATYSGTVNVAANATSGTTTVSIPAGSTSCQIAETLASRPSAPTNYTWNTPTYTQPSPAAMAPGGSASGSITNPLRTLANITVTKTVKTVNGSPATTSTVVGAGDTIVYTLTYSNSGQTAGVGTAYEVVPQHTKLTAIDTSAGTTACALSAAPGTACEIDTASAVPANSAVGVDITVVVDSPLAAGTTSIFNLASTTLPNTCSANGSCTTPPVGPTCVAPASCTNNPTSVPSVTVAKTVDATTPSPIGANQDAVFDLTVTNTVTGTTAAAGYPFYEVVPQNTTFTAISNGTTSCALPAAAGTLCTITVTNPIVAGAPQVLKATFHTINPLAAGTTSIFNLATQNTTTPPSGCAASNTACTNPPTSCAAGDTCASVPTSTADVTVVKTVDATTPNPIGANQDAVFDLTVTNTVTGTTEAAGYQFFEVVPQNTMFTTLTNGTTDCTLPAVAGTLCTITVTNPIVAGAPQVLKATFHTVNPLAAGTTSIFNLATQNTTTPPSGCATSGAVCTTPPTSCTAGDTCASVPTSTADVTVVKTVDATTPNPIGANQDAVFDLTVTNTVTGTTEAAGYQFFEVVPQNTTFTAISNGTTSCTLPAAAGTLCTITVTNPIVAGAPQVLKATFHTINPLAAGTTSIFNLATQNTTTPPSGCATSGAVCTTPPTSCTAGDTCASVPTSTADVTVVKTVDATTPNPIGANQDAVFDLTVTNTVTGTTEAAVYQFFEVVPQNTTFTAISNGTTSCTLPAAAGTLCTITVTNPIVAGAPQVLKATFHTINPLAAGTTSIFNLATQNTTTPPSGCTASNTACTTPPTSCPATGATCASVPTSTAAVTVAKTVDATTPNPIGANQNAIFDLTVTNTVTGTTAAAGYSFYEVVPQNTTFTAISNGTTSCTLPAAAGTLCTITVTNPIVAGAPQVLKATFHTANPLAAGTTSIFNLATQNTTTPPSGCTASNTACTTPPTSCPATGATCASVPTSTAAVTVAKTVDATTPSPIGANQNAIFDLTVTNTVTGTTAAAGYQFFEVVPQNTTFTAISNGTTDCTLPAAAGTLCTITVTNPIVAGAPQVLKATFHMVNPLAAGTTSIFNLATQNTTTPPSGCATSGAICTTPPTSCPATGATCASVPTSTAALTVAKTVDSTTPNPIGANQNAIFDLTVTNTVTGTTAAAGYQFYEVVPQNTTFTTLTNGTTDCTLPAAAGTLCTITVTNPVVAGTPQVLKATFHTVNPLAAGTTSIFNLATQNTTTPPSGCTASNTACTTPPTSCPATGATCASVPTSTAAVTVVKTVDAATPNPINANQNAIFDLTVTNTVTGTTAAAGYQFYEVVPQNTTFTTLTNGTTNCALPAAAGTLCTITVTNPIVAGAPQVLKATFHTINPLAAGTTSLFNLATQNTTTPPSGCTASNTACTTPPTSCPATGATCASVPTSTAAVTVVKTVDSTTPNPIGANQDAVFDLTVTNTVTGTTEAAGYLFYEVVPQNTTFTAISNGMTDCALPAAAGTLCTITVTNPIVAGAPQVLKATFHTINPLAAGTTTIFNLATQDTTNPPSGCAMSGAVCTMPPTSCPATGATCASVPTSTAAVTVVKTVDSTTPNPIGANQDAVFDLTVTNTVTGTIEAAGYAFYEVVPQNTTFTTLTNGTTDCALPAAAGTLCTITVTNPIVAGAPQVLKATFHTANPLAANTTSIFNLATQDTTTPPSGCATSGAACTTPPTSCPATGVTCASVPTSTAAVTVVKTVDVATPNPIGANQDAVFDLTVTNTVTGTTEAAGYQFFEVVPQNTMFTTLTNGTTDCTLPAVAGTLCTITVTNPIVAGAPQVLKATFHTINPLAAGTTSIFNLATQNTTTPPSGCATSGAVCTTPPTSCTAGNTCASVPTSTAAVTVVKTVDATTPNPIGANQDAVFNLTVTNTVTGTTEAAGYAFYEVVPQNTTFTTLANGTTDCALPAAAGTLCTITVTNPIVAGTPQVLKATFHTISPLAAGTTSIFNLATQDTTNPPSGCAKSGAVCTTPPTSCPATGATCASVPTSTAALTVAKAVDATTPSPISADQDAVFDLTVTNTVTGTTAAAGYSFYEVVPQNTTFTTLTNGTTDCTLPAAAGTLCTITVTSPVVAGAPQVLKATFHTINPLAAGTTSIFNLATQDTTNPPSGCATSGAVCTTPPTSCPATGATCASVPTSTAAMTVVKTVDAATPNPIAANQDAVFDLTVTNTVAGTTAAAGYSFYEVVPQNTTFTALTNGTTDCALPAVAGALCTITVTNPVVAGAPQVLKATFHTVSPLATGTTSIFNLATEDTTTPPVGCSASGSVCTTPPTSCPATGATCASVPTTQADMQAAGPTSVSGTIGVPVTVTTTCTNAGPDPATNPTCTVTFPGGTPAGATTSCTSPSNPLVLNGTITCTTTFTPSTAGTVQIVTTAGSDTLDPNTSNNTATTDVVTPSSASVTTVKTLDESTSTPIVAGQSIVYDLTATNTGGTAVTGYTINEVIPANTTLVSVTDGTTTASSTCSGGETAGTLCPITFAAVPAQVGTTAGTASVKVTLQAVSPIPASTLFIANEITEPATCTGATCSAPLPPDGCSGSPCIPPTSCPANDPHCVQTPVAIADMQATAPTTVTATIGTPVTVTTTCTNAGPNPAANATCVVTFPGGTPAGATTNCTTPSNPLALNGTITCTTTFTPVNATAVTIVTTAGSDTPDPDTTNNTATTLVNPGQITPTPDAGTTPFNTPVTINVTANDTVAGSTINPASVVPTQPAHGTVTCDTSGNCTYTPNAGFTGVDTYTYSVCDNSGPPPRCGSTTVTIAVGPNAVNDVLTTSQDTPANGNVSGNDTYPPNSTFTVVTNPGHGTVTMNPNNGSYTYTPNNGYSGTDTFTYQVCEAAPYQALCSTATVTITVTPPNLFDPPFISKSVAAVNTQTLNWTVVVDNNENASAQYTEVRDPLPAGLTFVSGSVTCQTFGSSTVSSCAFDQANNRIVADALLTSDLGVANPATAPNRLEIVFTAKYTTTPKPVTNIALACYDSANNPGTVSACTQSVSGTATYTPSQGVHPVPLDARWMLALMGLLLAAGATDAMRKRSMARGE